MYFAPTLIFIFAVTTIVLGSPVAIRSAKSAGLRTVGFYGNWDIYARDFWVTNIQASQLTHIVYSFMNVNTTTGIVYLSDEWADFQIAYPGDNTSVNGTNVYGGIKQLYLLKKANRSLKTMFSVGGFTFSSNFQPILKSEELRQAFANSAVSMMANLGFDGIDIDYESVRNVVEAAQIVDLLKKLREGLTAYAQSTNSTPYLLSFASPAGPLRYKQLDLEGMDQYLDFWNLMGFDYAGPWDTVSGHLANLHKDSSNKTATPYSTSSAIAYYTDIGGVAPAKINLGSPLYARAFANTAGPGKPYNGTGSAGSFGVAGEFPVKSLPAGGWNTTVYELEDSVASFSYDAARKYMLTYDTPAIARIKAEWIVNAGLGGAMWWEVSMDGSGEESLIGTTVEAFGEGMLDSSLNHLEYPTSSYDNLRNGK